LTSALGCNRGILFAETGCLGGSRCTTITLTTTAGATTDTIFRIDSLRSLDRLVVTRSATYGFAGLGASDRTRDRTARVLVGRLGAGRRRTSFNRIFLSRRSGRGVARRLNLRSCGGLIPRPRRTTDGGARGVGARLIRVFIGLPIVVPNGVFVGRGTCRGTRAVRLVIRTTAATTAASRTAKADTGEKEFLKDHYLSLLRSVMF
jgi:hypothetical protein